MFSIWTLDNIKGQPYIETPAWSLDAVLPRCCWRSMWAGLINMLRVSNSFWVDGHRATWAPMRVLMTSQWDASQTSAGRTETVVRVARSAMVVFLPSTVVPAVCEEVINYFQGSRLLTRQQRTTAPALPPTTRSVRTTHGRSTGSVHSLKVTSAVQAAMSVCFPQMARPDCA